MTGMVTAVSLAIYWQRGPRALQFLIYFKLITSAILMIANYRRQFPSDVFYLNFGVSLRLLTAITVSTDLLLWIAGLIVFT
ncbi:hypothetical protein [Neolewinella maritima]|uniref:hypothetical protein n=1 Tax=Neolewinella maritima TaxID=1383882 RepID=UPI001EE9056B|nr:hypothetical protein [Neolewinella maritima]